MRAKFVGTSRKVTPYQLDVAQPGDMSEDPVGFQGEHEMRRHDSEPSPIRLRRRNMIEGIIQLGRLKSGCVIAQPLPSR